MHRILFLGRLKRNTFRRRQSQIPACDKSRLAPGGLLHLFSAYPFRKKAVFQRRRRTGMIVLFHPERKFKEKKDHASQCACREPHQQFSRKPRRCSDSWRTRECTITKARGVRFKGKTFINIDWPHPKLVNMAVCTMQTT